MVGSFLITLREGLEAALIIGIILAYLARTGNRQGFRPVWIGTVAAVLVSLGAGAAIYIVAGELTGAAEQIFEGGVMIFAVCVLTWMIFWMRSQARDMKGHLQAQLSSALGKGSAFSLASIAFLVVVREGIEMALFLFAATRVSESFATFSIGALLGLAAAVLIGYLIYKGASRLDLRTFFNITSVVLIVFAAGLLAHGIHEFVEAGIIPSIIEHVWDTGAWLPDKSTAGRFLTAITGYNSDPALVEVISYIVYLFAALVAYFGPWGNNRHGNRSAGGRA